MNALGGGLSFTVIDCDGADAERLPALRHPLSVADAAELLAERSAIGLLTRNLDGSPAAFNSSFETLRNALGDEARTAFDELLDTVSARALGTGRAYSRLLKITGPAAARLMVRAAPVIDGADGAVGVAVAVQDWSQKVDRLNAAALDQARFRDFARASSDLFWEVNASREITAVSDRLTAILGIPASSFVGQPLDRLGVFEPNLSGDQPITTAWAQRTPFRNQLLRMAGPGGKDILFHISGVPLFNAEGTFLGYRGAGMDVTRVYHMEADARRTRNELQEALEQVRRKNAALDDASGRAESALNAKNEFLAAMSHELRTPLNAIIGFAEAMRMQVFGPLDDHYRSYAADIMNAGEHLLGLINDVLDVSVIESGEVSLSIQPTALKGLVETARQLLILRAEEKKIDLTRLAAPDGVMVMADERRALQILVNLIGNAVKFTPDGGAVGLDVASDGDTVSLSVWDTGPGIPEDARERVFEKFQQLNNNSYKQKPEGTGLGLHISRELARLMGGDIVAEPASPGARLTVYLPAA